VPVYAYEFNDRNAPERYLAPVGFPYGAAHESEVQYLFTLRNAPFPGVLTAQQRELATQMKNYWASLTRTGTPSSGSGPMWLRFTAAGQQMLSFVPPLPQTEASFSAEHHCGFWAQAG
jgi:para-nitrobenzyl esterase